MLMIRLRRMGNRNNPFFRVVVSDSRYTPRGPAVEQIGYYNPRRNPAELSIDRERVDYWVGHGAKMSETVAKLVKHLDKAPAASVVAEAEKATPAPVQEAAEKAAAVEAAPEVAEPETEPTESAESAQAAAASEEAPAAEATAAEGSATEAAAEGTAEAEPAEDTPRAEA